MHSTRHTTTHSIPIFIFINRENNNLKRADLKWRIRENMTPMAVKCSYYNLKSLKTKSKLKIILEIVPYRLVHFTS